MGNTTRRLPRKGPSLLVRALRLVILLALLAMIAALAGAAGLWVGISSNLPSLEAQGDYETAQTSKVFDSADPPNLLAELHGIENREVVTEDQIPQVVRDAVVAIEDARFYEHRGVDPIGIARALWADFRQRSFVQGGSTITQQFIKNAFISDEKTIDRKVKEAALAYQLERKWSKDKILTEYLNIIYFGEGAYGIQAAARTYFGIPASDLSLAQTALLVGVPKSPSNYSPRRNPEAARGRRDLILNVMFQQDLITSDELQSALTEDPVLAPQTDRLEGPVPYWVEMVREQLVARYGSTTVLQGGLRVYTSIDLRLQEIAERVIADTLDEPGDPSAALVSIDLRTGAIVAMVGGADFGVQQFNLATQGHRQPGSAFKTFVLAAALEQGISPGDTYDSGPITIELPGDDWNVKSQDSGRISLAEATAISSNGVFARLIMDVGPEQVIETARRLGVEAPLEPNPAIALGGLRTGVSPLEMAVAYGSIATGGERLSGSVVFDPDHPVTPISIMRVETAEGVAVDENQLVHTPVLDPLAAYQTTQALKDVIARGTGRKADISRPAAGKTGTTQSYRDAWFVGYTPDVVTSVWVGYPDEQKPMTDVHGISVTGGSFPAQIWAAYMNEALEGIEPRDFLEPAGSEWVTVSIDPESGLLATEWCPETISERFLKGTAPTEACPLHSPQEMPVPDVTGLTLAAARAALEEARFVAEAVEINDASFPDGLVISQDPAAGMSLLQGSTVRITYVVGGTSPGVVPTVVGLDVKVAKQSLKAAGYKVSTTDAVADAPAGIVLEQTPQGGTTLENGGSVDLVVSSGPPTDTTSTTRESVAVPDVIGQKLARALKALETAGLLADVAEHIATGDPQKDDTVATQSPAPGALLPRGGTVSLGVYALP